MSAIIKYSPDILATIQRHPILGNQLMNLFKECTSWQQCLYLLIAVYLNDRRNITKTEGEYDVCDYTIVNVNKLSESKQ